MENFGLSGFVPVPVLENFGLPGFVPVPGNLLSFVPYSGWWVTIPGMAGEVLIL